ncbi:MAG: hypothetical protein HZA78_10670, partial [Candidatus Schekmanbacteria bacterium]|nr:hypothetical protein [Candidatus Schekmanbacteria bacterium]
VHKILEIDTTLKTDMKDCANFSIMERKVLQAKCNLGKDCQSQIIAQMAPDDCAPDKLQRIDNTLPLEKWGNCDPAQYQAMDDLIEQMECNYLDRCGQEELSRLQKECNLREIFHLEDSLKGCQTQNKLGETIKSHKPQIVERCFNQVLDRAVQSCNLHGILNWEKLLYDKGISSDTDKAKFVKSIQQAENNYFQQCIENQLQQGRDKCNLKQIKNVEEKINQEFANHPNKAAMLGKVKEAECVYFTGCTPKNLEQAVDDCDYNQLQNLKKMSKIEEITHCPGYERIEPGLEDAFIQYFYQCAQKSLYKAYQDCNWQGIMDVEKLMEDDLKFFRDYQKIRVSVLEVKCSYFDTCQKKQMEDFLSVKDKPALEKLKKFIESEFAACPNYTALLRKIEEAR